MSVSSTVDEIVRDVKLGLDLLAAVKNALHAGHDIHSIRVTDVLPVETQLHLARQVADEKARQKFPTP